MKRYLKTKTYWVIAMMILVSCAETKQVSGQNSSIPKKALKYFDEGYKAYSYGEYQLAEEAFKNAIDKYPQYVDAYDALAKTYQVQGKKLLAVTNYRKVLALDPSHAFASFELGGIYFDQQNLDSSEYFYKVFMSVAGGNDKYVAHARSRLANIDFAKEAMKNPVTMNLNNLGSNINTKLEEYSPALTIDGKTIFFTFRDSRMAYQFQNEDIFFSEYGKDGWTKAKPIGPPINTQENEGAFSVSADGKYIFFTACNKPGGAGQCDIWLTMNKDGEWSVPMNLGKRINTKYWESQPSISSDGRRLYFTSNRPGGYGKTDLYVSTFSDSGWSQPVNLGPEINTSMDEQFPFIHPDGVTLYFSSVGHLGMGGADLYVTHLKPDKSWAKPKNLGYPINTLADDWNLIVSRDGETAYYSSDKNEGIGGMDLYSFKLPKDVQAQKVNYLKGIVIDAKSKLRLGAQVELIPLNGEDATYTFAPDKTGEFVVALRPNIRYALHVKKEGYLFYSDYFDMPESSIDEPFVISIPLQAIETGNTIVLNNVFFPTDEYSLETESEVELKKLAEFLKKNEGIRILLGGHTDNVGGEQHNKTLSENRAKAVYDYLVKEGIDASRMDYKGFGSSQPIASNDTKEGRAKNRRTEFTIID